MPFFSFGRQTLHKILNPISFAHLRNFHFRMRRPSRALLLQIPTFQEIYFTRVLLERHALICSGSLVT